MPSDHAYSRLSMALPPSAVRALGKLNVPIYRLTRGRMLGKWAAAPVLLLTTTGRRSGEPRTTPVVYLAEGERLVVIGSNAGNAHAPAWALNLKAEPDAEVEIEHRRRPIRARVAHGEERAELWRKMNELYAGFQDYERRTTREIAVFVLEPRP